MNRYYQNLLFAERRDSFSKRRGGKSIYYYAILLITAFCISWVPTVLAAEFDKAGVLAIDPQFDFASNFSESLAKVGVRGARIDETKYGYIDKSGKYVNNPQLEKAEPFKNGLALMATGGEWGYIDKAEKYVYKRQVQPAAPARVSDDQLTARPSASPESAPDRQVAAPKEQAVESYSCEEGLTHHDALGFVGLE